jgi:FTR1 family protein
MLQAFIITLREGVEAALIVGITLAYLTKIGRPELRKTVFAALAAAFLGSIGVAVAMSRAHLNEDVFEGWVMLVASFFVVTMVIFMMKTGRKLKGQIEGKIGLLAGNDAWFGLFVFIFLMVLRDGADEFSWHPGRSAGRDCVWRDVRQGQRADQSAEVL